MSDDRPTEEPEPTGEPAPRTPEEPAAPDAHPTTPLPPFADQPTESFAPLGDPYAPVPPPVPPAGYVPPAAPIQPPAGGPGAPTAPGAGWAEAWSPGQTPEWHDAQFTTGGISTAPSRKGLAITALVLGIAAVVFGLLGLVPFAGWVFLGLGGLLGVVALIVGIIAASGKNRDGRGMGITGLSLGALGVLLAIVAVVAQVLFIAAAVATTNHSASGSTSQVAPTPEGNADASTAPTPEASPTASGTYDEKAYLAAVKPALLALWRTIQPSATSLPWDDEFLITAGQEIQSVSGSASDLASMRDAFVGAATSQSKGVLSNAQAGEIFDIVAAAADKYLAG